VHLLKPSRLDVIPGQPDVVCADDAPQGPAQAAAWLEYPFRKSHPILRWLPTKLRLAAWISENFGQELGIPSKSEAEWTVGELNAIMENNLVPAMAAKDSFEPFAVFSGNVNSTADGPRHGAIPSI